MLANTSNYMVPAAADLCPGVMAAAGFPEAELCDGAASPTLLHRYRSEVVQLAQDVFREYQVALMTDEPPVRRGTCETGAHARMGAVALLCVDTTGNLVLQGGSTATVRTVTTSPVTGLGWDCVPCQCFCLFALVLFCAVSWFVVLSLPYSLFSSNLPLDTSHALHRCCPCRRGQLCPGTKLRICCVSYKTARCRLWWLQAPSPSPAWLPPRLVLDVCSESAWIGMPRCVTCVVSRCTATHFAVWCGVTTLRWTHGICFCG